jgi:hypothetical protein
MNQQTLLHRQVNPTFIRHDKASLQVFRPTSQVFCPTPKDKQMLSVSDGDKISAERAYQRFISIPLGKSIGVLSVSAEECFSLGVPPVPDPKDEEGQPDHCFLDFRGKSSNQSEKIATKLRNYAMSRG